MTAPASRGPEHGPWRLLPGATAIVGDHGHRPVVIAAGRAGELVVRDESGRLVQATPEHPTIEFLCAAPSLFQTLRNVTKVVQLTRAPADGSQPSREDLDAALTEIDRIAGIALAEADRCPERSPSTGFRCELQRVHFGWHSAPNRDGTFSTWSEALPESGR